MNISIEDSILKKYNLDKNEALLLYLLLRDINIQECIQSLLNKKLIEKNLFEENKYVLSLNTKNLIADVIVESEKKVLDNEKYFTSLAKKLQEIYPKGRKPGTTYMWRGTVAEIVKKLKTLIGKYNFQFTEEQAINATKTYVDSFNGNYTKMRLLKYFLLKADKDADGNINLISDFMSLIENEGQENVNNDWTTNLV